VKPASWSRDEVIHVEARNEPPLVTPPLVAGVSTFKVDQSAPENPTFTESTELLAGPPLNPRSAASPRIRTFQVVPETWSTVT
jgi:hypothetical protein